VLKQSFSVDKPYLKKTFEFTQISKQKKLLKPEKLCRTGYPTLFLLLLWRETHPPFCSLPVDQHSMQLALVYSLSEREWQRESFHGENEEQKKQTMAAL